MRRLAASFKALFCVAIAAGVSASVWFFYRMVEEIDCLGSQIDQVVDSVDRVRSEVDAVEKAVDSLESEVDGLVGIESDLRNIESTLEVMESSLSSIEDEVTGIDTSAIRRRIRQNARSSPDIESFLKAYTSPKLKP